MTPRKSAAQSVALPMGFESDQPTRQQPRNAFSTNALVYACVKLRSETALSTPIRVYNGENEVGERDAVRLLLEEPIAGVSWPEYREAVDKRLLDT